MDMWIVMGGLVVSNLITLAIACRATRMAHDASVKGVTGILVASGFMKVDVQDTGATVTISNMRKTNGNAL